MTPERRAAETAENTVFDLRTQQGIDEAQADLDAFKEKIDLCVTRDLLPWGLGIGHRQIMINKARESLLRAAQ